MPFSEAIVPLVSILTVISSLLIHWNSLDAASKRWRIVLLCFLVAAGIGVTLSCASYELGLRSEHAEQPASGASFEAPAADISEGRVDPPDLAALKANPYQAYGYTFEEGQTFFVSLYPEVVYAKPLDGVPKSEIELTHNGYDLWTRYAYHFDGIPAEALDAIQVEYLLFIPGQEAQRHPDGTLGDGSRILYDNTLIPSVTAYFQDYAQWPAGEYSLCLLLDGQYAGESAFTLLEDE